MFVEPCLQLLLCESSRCDQIGLKKRILTNNLNCEQVKLVALATTRTLGVCGVCLFHYVFVCFTMYLFVSLFICLFHYVFVCFTVYLFFSLCICLFHCVFVCFVGYLFASVCISF